MLCHRNSEQVNAVISKLCEFSCADIYIHVDLNNTNLRDEIKDRDNVFVLPENESYHIQWGSVDMVRATLQLIRKVRESNIEYDYLWLISGQDYPINQASVIENKLSSTPQMNYIETITHEDKRYTWYRKLYEIPYPSWINKNTFLVKVIKRIYILITGGHRHSFKLFLRKKPFSFDFYFGSQWWTITPDAAYDILQYSDDHPEILKYYEKCIIPDECFFQTLFMRGPYRDNRSMNLTFINWKNNRRSPEILNLDDLHMINTIKKEFCFARKMDYDDSSELIAMLFDKPE